MVEESDILWRSVSSILCYNADDKPILYCILHFSPDS